MRGVADSPLEEDVDLDVERRKWVLDLHTRLSAITHYEILDVPRDADKKAIKRAYFALAAKLHPDRYFGKKLGSFKPRMEALFARLTRAYDALLSPSNAPNTTRRWGPRLPLRRSRSTRSRWPPSTR